MLAGDVLDRIPTEPGVYLFKDARSAVIYVGKAKNLRTRVRQYFREGGDERFFVAAGFLGKAVADVETIVVTSSKEALLLENHLIKKHQPRFNVKLRDDKQYLVLRLVDPKPEADGVPRRAVFPRVEVVRNIRDDSASYFGPYHSATSARASILPRSRVRSSASLPARNIFTSSTCSAYAAGVTSIAHGPEQRLIWYCRHGRRRVANSPSEHVRS